MDEADTLPVPHLDARLFGARRVSALTDEALFAQTGVRVAFTGRAGGVSEGACASLNLGAHVGDDPARVRENRAILMHALDGPSLAATVAPKQVHGDACVLVDDASAPALADVRADAAAGADGVVVTVPSVAALLCFADCVPVVIVAPTGAFAVVHAGWRGVVAGIAPKAVGLLAHRAQAADASAFAARCNVYVGPHIHGECFEVGADLHERFTSAFGAACAWDATHVSLLEALAASLAAAGVARERIADAGVCTMCRADEFYSYRASGGACGRHGAVAFRKA